MKIGLIFPNKDRKDKTVHLGLGYLASYARSIHSDLEIIILDTRVATKKETRAFFEKSFDLIGITVLSPVYFEVINILKLLKEGNNKIKVCLGGPYVTTLMEEIFIETPADFAVYGEGELTFSELIYHLKGEKKIEDINGLMYKSESGEIKINSPRNYILDLDTLPMPAYDLFHMNRYPLHRIVTSRGCPFRCSFCNSSSIWEYKWRKRSAKKLIEEIEFLISNYKYKTFNFSDNSFNIDLERVNEFCELIIKKGINILWSTPIRVELITPILAKKMKQAGCYSIGIGIESANNTILANMDKQSTIEKINKGIRIFKEAGIEVLGQFVIGSPGDTLDTIKESLEYAKNSELDFVMFYSILPFKGTSQWEYVKNNGNLYTNVIHNYHTISPRIVFDTPEFSYEERLEAINLAKKAGYYSDANNRNILFDYGREFVKMLQNYLPSSFGNKAYLVFKNVYRKYK